jgi:hypothetical protein
MIKGKTPFANYSSDVKEIGEALKSGTRYKPVESGGKMLYQMETPEGVRLFDAETLTRAYTAAIDSICKGLGKGKYRSSKTKRALGLLEDIDPETERLKNDVLKKLNECLSSR